jgi:hypothetical protein
MAFYLTDSLKDYGIDFFALASDSRFDFLSEECPKLTYETSDTTDFLTLEDLVVLLLMLLVCYTYLNGYSLIIYLG